MNAKKKNCPKCQSKYSFDGKGKRYCSPCRRKWDKENRVR
jgi:uncharacterized Zn ribbon protein